MCGLATRLASLTLCLNAQHGTAKRLASTLGSMSITGGARKAQFTRSLEVAARSLRDGGLVAFPTETVYGLGAHAFDEKALLRIFEVKGRPKSDPLIVHVHSLAMAEKLVCVNDEGMQLLRSLGAMFWPGPLTIVAPAVAALPSVVTAGSGAVGVRWPAHEQAQALLKAADIPVAAPSANRFGHVSPTRAQHVMSDLGLHDILILEASEAGCCDVGIESTVVKLDEQSQQLVLLRRGGIPESVLASWMQDHGGPFELVIKAPSSSGSSASKAAAVTTAAPAVSAPTASPSPSAHEEEIAQEAPGMLLTHYAPDVPSYLLRFAAAPAVGCEAAVAGAGEAPCELKHAAVLDFGGRAKELAAVAMAYRDLSDVADAAAAATRVFEFLRWAEEKQALGARYVLLPDVLGGDAASSSRCNDEHLPALADRLYRAASGRSARLVENGFFVADAE